MYYYYYTVTLQFSFSFEIFSKKLEGKQTKGKKLQKRYIFTNQRGRIKTAVLPSVHFSSQEETQGKVDDGV